MTTHLIVDPRTKAARFVSVCPTCMGNGCSESWNGRVLECELCFGNGWVEPVKPTTDESPEGPEECCMCGLDAAPEEINLCAECAEALRLEEDAESDRQQELKAKWEE